MNQPRKVSEIPHMNDHQLQQFWEENEPEDFDGWEQGALKFTRAPKKLIQLRLDPRDVRIIDRESKRSGIGRAQLVRSWVKKKIAAIEKESIFRRNEKRFDRIHMISRISFALSAGATLFAPWRET